MKGYRRRFRLEGLNMERLIRQAGETGIILHALRRKGRRISGTVAEEQIDALRTLAERGGWRMEAGGRVGLGRLADRARGRLGLVIGGVIVGTMIAAASQMMWRVEVTGSETYAADIRQYLTEQGIQPVCWKGRVDPGEMRDVLEWRYPEVAWIETGWRGVTLQIRVVEGTMPGETLSTDGSCDVVATRDGIISSVVTVAGTPVVQAGEIVHRGQVLIQGSERTAQGGTRPVAARGTVMARVWDAASVTMSAYEHRTVYTGRRYETQRVVLPWFSLWRQGESRYAQEDVSMRMMPLGGVFLPLTVRWEEHREAQVTLQKRDEEQLKGEAGVAAMRKLRQKIGLDDDLVDKWVEFSMIESEQVCAVAYGERVIDIARQDRDGAQ